MGFLHKLWDDTLAGPAPDKVLRKYDSFSGFRSPPAVTIPPHDHLPVTRSITILRANSVDSGSLPSSPVAGSSTPTSPFSPISTPRGDFKRFARRKSTAAPSESVEPISPTVYDWIVINALDRWERKWRFCMKNRRINRPLLYILKGLVSCVYLPKQLCMDTQ